MASHCDFWYEYVLKNMAVLDNNMNTVSGQSKFSQCMTGKQTDQELVPQGEICDPMLIL